MLSACVRMFVFLALLSMLIGKRAGFEALRLFDLAGDNPVGGVDEDVFRCEGACFAFVH